MEIKEQLIELLSPEFIVKDIDRINYKPHPFTIGGKHVTYAADNFGGILGEEAILSAEKKGIYCAHPHCKLPYKEHTLDKVCFLQLTRNLSQQEAQEKLKSVIEILKENKIDGFTFVDTPEKFRIS